MIPVLNRLTIVDYQRLILTWILLILDLIVRIFLQVWAALKLPFSWPLLLSLSKRIDAYFPSLKRWEKSAEVPTYSIDPLARIHHTVEMGAFWGYHVEEYIAHTPDGYFLGLHRIIPRNSGGIPSEGPPVLLWHGFMMNSEVWLAQKNSSSHNLALLLSDQGYDVWLGNVRGNKYSLKHARLHPSDKMFWDFCLDDHALIDIPTVVDFVLGVTGYSSLSYVGFSQGTTIMFAALSLLPALRHKVNLMIALAPSTKPRGLSNSFISAAVKSSPELIYLIFGRRSLLSSAHYYQSLMSPSLYQTLIDTCVSILFKWKGTSMSNETKAVAYQHLYSLCSVKVMVQWFQIMREGRFQMYDDIGRILSQAPTESTSAERHPRSRSQLDISTRLLDGHVVLREDSLTRFNITPKKPRMNKNRQTSFSQNLAADFKSSFGHTSPRYPTDQIRYDPGNKERYPGPPIALFYGGSDTLLDMQALLKGLRFPLNDINFPEVDDTVASSHNGTKGIQLYSRPLNEKSHNDSPVVYLKCIPPYEHLCFLWGDDVDREIYPDVVSLIKQYATNT